MTERRALFQTAYHVVDVEAAAIRWNRLYGAGPFVVLPHYRMEKIIYRGQECDPAHFPDFSYALGYLGDHMIQFTAQHNDVPSVYRDMYRAGEEGFHHVAHLTSAYDAEVARLVAMGFEVGMAFEVDGARGAYVDTRSATGGFTEIHSDPPELLAGFALWRQAHEAWRPGDPAVRDPSSF